MSTAHDVHEAARAARLDERARADGRGRAISTARLVVAMAALVGVGALAWASLPSWAWAIELGLVAIFVVLIVAHDRVHRRLDELSLAVTFHERALGRLADSPAVAERTPTTTAPDDHPYADDLDLFGPRSLFTRVDASATRAGEAVLARWLLGADPFERDVVRARQEAVRELASRITLRERFAVASGDGSTPKPDPAELVAWLSRAPAFAANTRSTLRVVAFALPALTLALFVAGRIGLVPSLAWLLGAAAGVGVLTLHRSAIGAAIGPASSRSDTLSSYREVFAAVARERFRAPRLVELSLRIAPEGRDGAREAMDSLGQITGFLEARQNEVFRLLVAPLLVWDLHGALALDRWRERAAPVLEDAFEALSELEALASLSQLAFENPEFAFPELVDEACFVAEGLVHPLLARSGRVGNDVALAGPGSALIVTGSNMAGKSTLLRSMGLAAVLGRAGGPSPAKSSMLGPLATGTSLRVRDSVADGKSRFFAELQKIGAVVAIARSAPARGERAFFLLDEVLSGTNARERLVGARSLVDALLAEGAVGAVSTHDLALGDLETRHPGRVANVHFEEQVEGDTMTFDYRLRPGVVGSSNALRLMAALGLPVPMEASTSAPAPDGRPSP